MGMAGERIKLYYLRDAQNIATVLNAVAAKSGSDFECLTVATASQDEIILYGPEARREHARRVIARLDLPRPGINMEMWGIQISSKNPEEMSAVMPEIREEINRTQRAVREMYNKMQNLARTIIRDEELDQNFKRLIEIDLGYKSALDPNRPLSFTDILLRLVAAQDPFTKTGIVADRLSEWYTKTAGELKKEHAKAIDRIKKVYKSKKSKKPEVEENPELERHPFENFFGTRGIKLADNGWTGTEIEVTGGAFQARMALLDFGMNYARMIHEPRCFSPYYLQHSADILNTRLQHSIDALNLDIQEMFVEPTLKRIQRIVRNFDDVEYAQVGKTSVASLSGIKTEVTSSSVNAFDVTPPLRLSELLTKATDLAGKVNPFIPEETKPGAAAATELTAGALPISQVIGLIAAFGEERSVWRELKSGISLTITPNVLRNMNTAELQIELATGDPGGTKEDGVPPLSRVSQHDVKTSIYVNALDFFDLSAFDSQSTLNGGRRYVPIIGPVWRGIFSDVPGIGKLFSWKKGPQTVYQQSLVLTDSFITPTAMGVALLYPTTSEDYKKNETAKECAAKTFYKAKEAIIDSYRVELKNRLGVIASKAARSN
ncbi:MAG TPA: hypothetical protein VJZ26_19550 [Blastocatellia bacterium]|nr:hypothetical protein [Blastocatellia bacterium]